MPRHRREVQDDDDDDDEGYDPSDEYDAYRDYDPDDEETYPDGVYNDDGPPVVPCPYCKREIAEDAERCPYCENYLSKEDAPPSQKSWFTIVMLALAILIAVMWLFG